MVNSGNAATPFNNDTVKSLFALAITLSAMEFAENKMKEKDFSDWTLRVSTADNADLIALISLLDTRNKDISRELKALREAAIAQVAFNNATLISQTMKKLDKTATYLTIVSILLGVIATAAAILELVR